MGSYVFLVKSPPTQAPVCGERPNLLVRSATCVCLRPLTMYGEVSVRREMGPGVVRDGPVPAQPPGPRRRLAAPHARKPQRVTARHPRPHAEGKQARAGCHTTTEQDHAQARAKYLWVRGNFEWRSMLKAHNWVILVSWCGIENWRTNNECS